MKKSLLIIFTIVILGLAALAAKNHKTNGAAQLNTPISQGTTTATPPNSTSYKDGSYQGKAYANDYGTVQIAVVVSASKITSVNFLQMPGGFGHSQEVTNYSGPILRQETLSAQSANIDFVSGATQTSEAYQYSLQSALDQAKAS